MLRSLDDPDPIPVQWRLTQHDDVMNHPANLTPVSMLLTASSDDITKLVGEFRKMRRRLVLAGDLDVQRRLVADGESVPAVLDDVMDLGGGGFQEPGQVGVSDAEPAAVGRAG
ncbi:MAG: hypothetical protein JWN52_4608 [Actinomycetia bacterium]|nr:hypothetical protein [Actinomycetes bacterium]